MDPPSGEKLSRARRQVKAPTKFADEMEVQFKKRHKSMAKSPSAEQQSADPIETMGITEPVRRKRHRRTKKQIQEDALKQAIGRNNILSGLLEKETDHSVAKKSRRPRTQTESNGLEMPSLRIKISAGRACAVSAESSRTSSSSFSDASSSKSGTDFLLSDGNTAKDSVDGSQANGAQKETGMPRIKVLLPRALPDVASAQNGFKDAKPKKKWTTEKGHKKEETSDIAADEFTVTKPAKEKPAMHLSADFHPVDFASGALPGPSTFGNLLKGRSPLDAFDQPLTSKLPDGDATTGTKNGVISSSIAGAVKSTESVRRALAKWSQEKCAQHFAKVNPSLSELIRSQRMAGTSLVMISRSKFLDLSREGYHLGTALKMHDALCKWRNAFF